MSSDDRKPSEKIDPDEFHSLWEWSRPQLVVTPEQLESGEYRTLADVAAALRESDGGDSDDEDNSEYHYSNCRSLCGGDADNGDDTDE